MNRNINVIPTPRSVTGGISHSFHKTGICPGEFAVQCRVFVSYAAAALRLEFSEGDDIVLCRAAYLAAGEYRLEISEDTVKIAAGDEYAAGYALSTLLQLSAPRDGKLYLPDCVISDAAECEYRGLLIDCARNRHPLPLLMSYVDMCWLYKLRHLHLHLSDDESYTLPSSLFPQLTTPNNCFSRDEISQLVGYAAERGVQLVPEIDSPGHTEAIRRAAPDIFGKSGIMSFTRRSLDAVCSLYGEVCGLFPNSEFVHIGGDESRLGWWMDSDECIAFAREQGIRLEDEAPGMPENEYVMLRILARFIDATGAAVRAEGRRPIVWEGFHQCTNDMISRETAVMVFESQYQLANSLLSSGFKVINCSWKPTYIVTPTWHWSERECYDWDVYSFSAVSPASPYYGGVMQLNAARGIIGGQLSSWGDSLGTAFGSLKAGLDDEYEKISERVPAVAENTWNREKRGSYDGFFAAREHAARILAAITEASK